MSLIRSCRIEWLEKDGPGYAINPYIGCGIGCYKAHCWAYLEAKRHGRARSWEEWQRPKIDLAFQGIPIAVQVQREALRLPANATVLLSATSDPFQPDCFGYDCIVEEILRGFSRASNYPALWILTKSGTGIARHMDWIESCRAKVGITVTSLERTD